MTIIFIVYIFISERTEGKVNIVYSSKYTLLNASWRQVFTSIVCRENSGLMVLDEVHCVPERIEESRPNFQFLTLKEPGYLCQLLDLQQLLKYSMT